MTASILCCPSCFRFETIRSHIRQIGSDGNCPSCGETRTKVTAAINLAPLFDAVLLHYDCVGPEEFYDVPEEDQLAAALVADGLNPFSDSLSHKQRSAILDAFLLGHSQFRLRLSHAGEAWIGALVFKYAPGNSPWDHWRNYIRNERRYVVDYSAMTIPNVPELLRAAASTFSLTVDQKVLMYRARSHSDSNSANPFQASELQAPLAHLATGGRVNAAGIPVLYAADSEETAVAEIRPHLGALVCVGAVAPKSRLKIFDFSGPLEFSVTDPTTPSIGQQIEARVFISVLDRLFSEPIAPHLPERDYAPTRHVAETLQSLGFDGIKYRSAMKSGGFNYAFFSPAGLEVAVGRTVKISEITVKFDPYDFRDPDNVLEMLRGAEEAEEIAEEQEEPES